MIDFQIDNYLRISWQDVLLVCISTFIIVLVCRRFFWDKLIAFINKRQALIQNNIDSSQKLRQEAQESKNKYDEKLAAAGARADAIIDRARHEADIEKTQIISAAKAQAENIERAAQEDIKRDRQRAQSEMKNAISDVALAAASQILEQEIDEDKQREIIDRVIEQAGDDRW